MQTASTRRHFIQIFPLAGLTMIAACSEKPAPAPAPAPMTPPPEPTPAPAPAAAPAAEPAPAPAAAPAAPATTGSAAMVEEKDAQAVALGYVQDAARADKVKYPKFVAGSHCATCGLYQGKAGDAAGGCPLFPGKQVSTNGWCSAWVKKA